MSLLIRSGTILTMNDRFDIVDGDVSIRDGRIAEVGTSIAEALDRVIDARGGYVLPGFIQTHIHLCQTLFRGFADDLPLMDWLRRRVWPMEAAHTPATLRAAARLATTELLSSGTTSVLTMETVHDTDVVFETVAASGMRATIGKCMTDFDAQVPRRLQEETRASLDESVAIRRRWDGAATGRAMSGGLSNLQYLASLHLASPHLCAAHCVWADEDDQRLLAEHDVKVM